MYLYSIYYLITYIDMYMYRCQRCLLVEYFKASRGKSIFESI